MAHGCNREPRCSPFRLTVYKTTSNPARSDPPLRRRWPPQHVREPRRCLRLAPRRRRPKSRARGDAATSLPRGAAQPLGSVHHNSERWFFSARGGLLGGAALGLAACATATQAPTTHTCVACVACGHTGHAATTWRSPRRGSHCRPASGGRTRARVTHSPSPSCRSRASRGRTRRTFSSTARPAVKHTGRVRARARYRPRQSAASRPPRVGCLRRGWPPVWCTAPTG